MFSATFYETLIITIVGVGLAGVALWTWQRMYWEYQVRRQTEDWKHRQTYSRRDSQRVAMEELLVEMNRALEDFVTATVLVGSAIQRRHDYRQAGGTDKGLARWDQEVEKSVEQFNESERGWLAESRVISGKIGLHFDGRTGKFVQLWDEIIHHSEGTCTILNSPTTTLRDIWDKMLELRNLKNELLRILEREIDRFVSEELEHGPE